MRFAVTRYDQLLNLIHVFQPQTFIEVGVWNGHNAIRMLKTAKQYHEFVRYTGYDLFEDGTAELDAAELNVKTHNKAEEVGKLIAEKTACDVTLIRGNTRATLAAHTYADFAFIDGGHSIETIESDYRNLMNSGIILLDDYYTPDETGACPDVNKYGCNKLVHLHIKNYRILPHKDRVQGGGFNQLVLVCS